MPALYVPRSSLLTITGGGEIKTFNWLDESNFAGLDIGPGSFVTIEDVDVEGPDYTRSAGVIYNFRKGFSGECWVKLNGQITSNTGNLTPFSTGPRTAWTHWLWDRSVNEWIET